MASFRPMFHFGENEIKGNAQRFATRDEAEGSASERFRNWYMPTDWSVEKSNDPVNYIWMSHTGDVSLCTTEDFELYCAKRAEDED
jgi:hypothetical protein|tara:strand:+ start:72 stop:329 length:258 start_codon:yes stop_codon:yes gene_type:complete